MKNLQFTLLFTGKNQSFAKCVSRILFIILFTLSGINLTAQTDYTEKYDSRKFIDDGIQFYDNDKYAESIAEFDKVSKTDPYYLEAQYEKSMSLYASDKKNELKQLLDELYVSGEMKDFPDLYGIYGIYFSDNNEYDHSEKIFKEGEQYAPESNLILFNLALLYLKKEENQKAVDYLKKNITLNPNNASAYYFLGLTAFDDGKIVEGSMCLLAYLMISPYGNYAPDAILKLNTKMGTLYSDDHKLILSDKGDDFSELELVLKNELPLSDKYKVNSTIDDNYTRQVQAIMEYAATHQVKDGFFENTFVPWMADIAKNGYTENFMYYTLFSLEKEIGKPLSSQKKKVETFVDNYVAKSLWDVFAKRNIEHFGKREDVIVYLREGKPYSYGKVKDGKYEGKFRYVNSWGSTLSEVNYVAGELEGPAVYYYRNGKKSDEITYVKSIKNGPFKSYFTNGNLLSEGSYKNDKLEDAYTSYYPNGGIHCQLNFTQDVRNGKSICYSPNGKKLSEYNYVNGKADGKGFNYNESGDVISEFSYVNDLYEGKGITYYGKQQIKAVGNYKAGELISDYKEYFENNSTKKEYSFANEKITKSTEYNPNQGLRTEIFIDEKGNVEKFLYYDESGRKYFEENYKKGIYETGFQYTKDKPEATETDNRSLVIKNFDGIPLVAGQYSKGEMEGEWKYFFSNGDLKSKVNFKKNETNGLRYEYRQDGNLTNVQNLVNGKTNGIYEEFDSDKLYLKMYFENDESYGPYQYYYANGQVSLEGYLSEGDKSGKQFAYYKDGSLKYIHQYIDDHIISSAYFNKDGSVNAQFDYTGRNGIFEIKKNNGLLTLSTELKNGIKNGKEVLKSTDGSMIYELTYENEALNGPYKRYSPSGKLSFESTYYSGKINGDAFYYDLNGNLRFTTAYIFGKEYGNAKSYYQNKQILLEYSMLEDKINGEQVYHNIQGKPIAAIGYVLDEIAYYKILDGNGNLGEAKKIDNSNFTIQSVYPNGKTAFKCSFVKKLKNGQLEIYDESGQANYTANYANNKLHGQRTQYYANGNVYKREAFRNGDFQGLQEFFSEDGKLTYSAEYDGDDLHGDFKIYNNGKLVKTKKYDSDELVAIQ